MTNQEFTKSLTRTRIVLVREIDEKSGCGKGQAKRMVLFGDDKAIAEFTKQYHQDRSILL